MLQITGTLKIKKDEQIISDKFKKREFVLSDDHDQYEQLICFQLAQDKTSLIDAMEIGSQITVHFNLRGREWTNKDGVVMHFNTLDALRVELLHLLQHLHLLHLLRVQRWMKRICHFNHLHSC